MLSLVIVTGRGNFDDSRLKVVAAMETRIIQGTEERLGRAEKQLSWNLRCLNKRYL